MFWIFYMIGWLIIPQVSIWNFQDSSRTIASYKVNFFQSGRYLYKRMVYILLSALKLISLPLFSSHKFKNASLML